MDCDMCGRGAELYNALIEGSQMTVCKSCAAYGKVLGKARQERTAKPVQIIKESESAEAVAENFGELLKRKREQLGMSHKEFAARIAEKESVLRKLETGSMRPTLEKARQLGKELGLKLVEEVREEPVTAKKDARVVTLGDMARVKVRKNK